MINLIKSVDEKPMSYKILFAALAWFNIRPEDSDAALQFLIYTDCKDIEDSNIVEESILVPLIENAPAIDLVHGLDTKDKCRKPDLPTKEFIWLSQAAGSRNTVNELFEQFRTEINHLLEFGLAICFLIILLSGVTTLNEPMIRSASLSIAFSTSTGEKASLTKYHRCLGRSMVLIALE